MSQFLLNSSNLQSTLEALNIASSAKHYWFCVDSKQLIAVEESIKWKQSRFLKRFAEVIFSKNKDGLGITVKYIYPKSATSIPAESVIHFGSKIIIKGSDIVIHTKFDEVLGITCMLYMQKTSNRMLQFGA